MNDEKLVMRHSEIMTDYTVPIIAAINDWMNTVTIDAATISHECLKIINEHKIEVHDCINHNKKDIIVNIPNLKTSLSNEYSLPRHIYVTDKATTFEYNDKNDKIILYKKSSDKMDLIGALLWAQFLRNTGLSKTQMHKFADALDNSVKNNIEVPKKHK